MPHGAKNVDHGAKNVQHGATMVQHGAKNVPHYAKNVRHGAKNVWHGMLFSQFPALVYSSCHHTNTPRKEFILALNYLTLRDF